MAGGRRGVGGSAAVLAASWLLAVAAPTRCDAGLVVRIHDGGGLAPANLAGGGTLLDLAHVAARQWERAFADEPGAWEVDLDVGWGDLGRGSGVFRPSAQGGDPHRIRSGAITLNNSGFTRFFADPTPEAHEEFADYREVTQDYGAGPINAGRFFAAATGEAAGRLDLLTTVLHEIGHSLGLSEENAEFRRQRVDGLFLPIDDPLPHAGMLVSLSITDHIDEGYATRALMIPTQEAGRRTLVSGLDVLVNAQIGAFARPNLNPYAAPEPPSGLLLAAGAFVAAGRVRRRDRFERGVRSVPPPARGRAGGRIGD